MSETFDVIIGGAGPVGLFLACELGMRGISVLVLERDGIANSLWKSKPFGLRGLNTLSVEAFYRRGMLNDVVDAEYPRPTVIEKTSSFKFAGHFAGIMLNLNKLDLSRWKYCIEGPGLMPSPTSLQQIDSVLSERAISHGVRILRGMTVTDVLQVADTVTVKVSEKSFSAKFVVGCDGGRSVIRKSAGFTFVGTDSEFTGFYVQCELDAPEKLKQGFQLTKEGMYIMLDSEHVIIMDFDSVNFDRSKSVTQDYFQAALRRISGTDIAVKSIGVSTTFTDRAKQATTYRKGRVLLAGDSAHIHSPLGAQGLNTGIGDAINLGWKLAAVIRGEGSTNLLDTYEQERHPVGARVLEWSRAQVATMRPGNSASTNILRDLINTTDGTNYFIGRIWGLSQKLEISHQHPLVGCSVPDFKFVDGTRLGPRMQDGKGLLIDFANDSSLRELTQELLSQINYLCAQAEDTLGLRALLVRPDGITVWACDGPPDLKSLQVAMLTWFGLKHTS